MTDIGDRNRLNHRGALDSCVFCPTGFTHLLTGKETKQNGGFGGTVWVLQVSGLQNKRRFLFSMSDKILKWPNAKAQKRRFVLVM